MLAYLAAALLWGAQESQAQTTSSPDPNKASSIVLDHIPSDAEVVFVIRPKELLTDELLRILEEQLTIGPQYNLPVPITEIEQVTYVREKKAAIPEESRAETTLVFDLNIFFIEKPMDWNAFVEKPTVAIESATHDEVTYYRLTSERNICFWPAGPHVFVVGPEASLQRAIERRAAPVADSSFKRLLEVAGGAQAVIELRSSQVLERLPEFSNRPNLKAPIRLVSALLKETDSMAIAIEAGTPLIRMQWILSCESDEVAKQRQSLFGALLGLMKRFTAQQNSERQQANQPQPDGRILTDAGSRLFENTEIKAEGNHAVLSLAMDVELGHVLGLVSSATGELAGYSPRYISRQFDQAAMKAEAPEPAVPQAVLTSPKLAQRRSVSLEKAKKVSEAFLKYNEENGSPPGTSADAPERHLLSWRVHLLPALGYDELYREFHLDEPWDSSHNRSLIEKMPMEYAGPNSIGTGQEPECCLYAYLTPMAEAGSATRDALLLIECRLGVPWTKPEDISAGNAPPKPLHPGGWVVARHDGSVEFLPSREWSKPAAAPVSPMEDTP